MKFNHLIQLFLRPYRTDRILFTWLSIITFVLGASLVLRSYQAVHLQSLRPHQTLATRTCSTFQTQASAQEYFSQNKAANLDGDKDGKACESLK